MCIDELEVTAHGEHNVVCAEVVAQVCDIIDEPFSFPVSVEFCVFRICDKYTLIFIIIEEVKISWRIVGVSNHHEG